MLFTLHLRGDYKYEIFMYNVQYKYLKRYTNLVAFLFENDKKVAKHVVDILTTQTLTYTADAVKKKLRDKLPKKNR
jgi:hypothetical protein